MRVLLTLVVCAASLFGAGELSGRRAPGFSLADPTGRQQDPQDYRGKYLLIEFFQSTCPHCATFAPILEEVRAKYAGKLAVLSVAVFPDKAPDVMRFMQAHKAKYPVVFDCGQVAASYYKATPQNPSVGFPHVFLVDPQGMIRNDWGYSMLTRDIFEGRGLFRELDRMLGAAPAPAGKSKK